MFNKLTILPLSLVNLTHHDWPELDSLWHDCLELVPQAVQGTVIFGSLRLGR